MATNRLRLVVLALVLALAGCRSAPRPASPAQAPATPAVRAQWYEAALARGERVFAVDAERSLVTVTVRRGGRLARLGHDHVVSSRKLGGFVAPGRGQADLWLRADQLEVDDPALRGTAMGPQPSLEAVAGTRRNMLEHVLQAGRHPWVMLRARPAGPGQLTLEITLNGQTRAIEAPVRIDGSGPVSASGSFRLRQSDFGIAPFSVLGGALAVQDEVEVSFDVTAR